MMYDYFFIYSDEEVTTKNENRAIKMSRRQAEMECEKLR